MLTVCLTLLETPVRQVALFSMLMVRIVLKLHQATRALIRLGVIVTRRISRCTGTAIGTGQANTTAIITQSGQQEVQHKLCDNLILSGYDDWFLPSKDELNLMYTNLKVAGLGGFADAWYWSSSEVNFPYAWFQNVQPITPQLQL